MDVPCRYPVQSSHGNTKEEEKGGGSNIQCCKSALCLNVPFFFVSYPIVRCRRRLRGHRQVAATFPVTNPRRIRRIPLDWHRLYCAVDVKRNPRRVIPSTTAAAAAAAEATATTTTWAWASDRATTAPHRRRRRSIAQEVIATVAAVWRMEAPLRRRLCARGTRQRETRNCPRSASASARSSHQNPWNRRLFQMRLLSNRAFCGRLPPLAQRLIVRLLQNRATNRKKFDLPFLTWGAATIWIAIIWHQTGAGRATEKRPQRSTAAAAVVNRPARPGAALGIPTAMIRWVIHAWLIQLRHPIVCSTATASVCVRRRSARSQHQSTDLHRRLPHSPHHRLKTVTLR